MRINKYLASFGVASRRKVDEMIEAGKVRINGRAARLGEQVDPARDRVSVGGKEIGGISVEKVYFAVNKPKGVISTARDTHGRPTVVSLVRSRQRLFPVGRLDAESEGLMILTNDGELMQRMTHPKYHVPKVYEIVILGNLSEERLARLRGRVKLRDGSMTVPAQVRVLADRENKTVVEMILKEGKNRQIRRMCEALHLHLLNLKRVAMGPIELGDLPSGSRRKLEDAEVKELYRVAGLAQPPGDF
ncbi:MAG: pseudouridine synthase [Candidatus Curtissbacteria bacterium]